MPDASDGVPLAGSRASPPPRIKAIIPAPTPHTWWPIDQCVAERTGSNAARVLRPHAGVPRAGRVQRGARERKRQSLAGVNTVDCAVAV